MAYGITSESQLIDVATIKSGCSAYIKALDFFTEGGNKITEAGHFCNKQALSVDGQSYEDEICEVGKQVTELRDTYAGYAEAVYGAAVQVYNAQVAELNEYNRWLAQQRAAQQQQNN